MTIFKTRICAQFNWQVGGEPASCKGLLLSPQGNLSHPFGLIVLVVALLGLPLSGTVSAAALKIATLPPEGSVWMNLLRAGGKRVEAETAGRVSFKFYPGGVMGDDKAVLRKMRVGQLHGAVVTSSALVQSYPEIGLYGLPMAFQSGAEADYVRERMDAKLLQGLREKGFVSFGIAEIGFAHAMSQAVITNVADARKMKVWVPDNDPGAARAFGAFGIAPIPLPIADVLGGLQTRLIDSVATPPVGAIALQWHTRLDHVMDLPLVYVYGLLAIAKRPFDRLTESDRAAVRRAMGEVVDQVNARSRDDHEKASAALKKQGLTWHETTGEERREWRRLADLSALQMVDEGYIGADIYQEMRGHLQAYRARRAKQR